MSLWQKTVVIVATVALTSFPLAAQAAPEIVDVTDPTAMMSAELLGETNPNLPYPQEEGVEAPADTDLLTEPGLAVVVADQSSEATSLEPVEGVSGEPLEISAPFDEAVPTLEAGITVFEDPEGDAATFIQPIDDGLRYLTAIESEEAGTEFSYVVQGAEDGYLQKITDDEYVLLSADDNYIVTVEAPWAIDSAGQELATSYTFEGNTLTQTVTYESDTEFPVLADPTWYYQVDHRSYTYITGKEKAAASRVIPELNRCFNCSFPVSGAPSYFPAVGAKINLNASPFSLIKIPAPVQVSHKGSVSFGFLALAGHFDGAGSTVSFRFYNDASGWLHINVYAKVVKDRGAVANDLNKRVASQTWANFLANLIRRTSL
ncbi:hypothetical protein E2F48_11440 [Arthrobacter crusticola]|uniref:Uncharacterized protein n=1 Tax=Arthrobacter crusticola TaxID=2547960 RepID=A0A4R5TXG0_9MICC|nr:hypothetical protein [Arthrobacter crusticola]TDK25830.1 hypothetical protein E2F48_11440 [Arthrobacter crusticola]